VPYGASRRHLNPRSPLSYARIFLSTIILIAVIFFLLKVVIVSAIFGVFALIVLIIVLKEGL
jgi:membrane protein required for beta-lactamase induction